LAAPNPKPEFSPERDWPRRLAKARTRLFVDESFVNFCAGGYSLEGCLTDHPNLVIIKSMSKAYGIAGLRLGYLSTTDAAFLKQVTGELPIWNINGSPSRSYGLPLEVQDGGRIGLGGPRERGPLARLLVPANLVVLAGDLRPGEPARWRPTPFGAACPAMPSDRNEAP
jgi:hypothetical protein